MSEYSSNSCDKESQEPEVASAAFVPASENDDPSVWRIFSKFIRQKLGYAKKASTALLITSKRWQDSQISKIEIENEVKLIRAKAEAQLNLAKARAEDRKSLGQRKKAEAEAVAIKAKADLMKQEVENSKIVRERLDAVLERIATTSAEIGRFGGRVAIELPDSEEEPSARDEEEPAV